MPLRYLLDEHLRGPLWRAIRRHNTMTGLPLDSVRVGDALELPLGIADPAILLWAEREQRLLVSADKKTMASHLAAHLAAGHHCPGIFMLLPGASVHSVLEYLALAAYASEPAEWADRIQYIR